MKPQLLTLPKILDPRGNLTFIENDAQVPFVIKRAYWIYDVPAGEERHGHAFRTASELIVALSGSFDVVLDDGNGEQRFSLGRSFYGLLVPPMTWRRIDNFSTNSVALVLSSTNYDENDYIRDKDSFNSQCNGYDSQCNELNSRCNEYDSLCGELNSHPASCSPASGAASLDECRVVDLSRISHPNGALTAVDNADNIFPIKRVFYLYDVPGDSERGGHSHFKAQELIVAASGAFDVVLTDGVDSRRFTLNRPYKALYIPNGIWRSLDNFSSGSVSLVLTSELYSEEDYCRSMTKYREIYVRN